MLHGCQTRLLSYRLKRTLDWLELVLKFSCRFFLFLPESSKIDCFSHRWERATTNWATVMSVKLNASQSESKEVAQQIEPRCRPPAAPWWNVDWSVGRVLFCLFVHYQQESDRSRARGSRATSSSRAPTSWRATCARTPARRTSSVRCATSVSCAQITWGESHHVTKRFSLDWYSSIVLELVGIKLRCRAVLQQLHLLLKLVDWFFFKIILYIFF